MTTNDHALLPDIMLCDSEHASLSNLALEAEQRLAGVGEPLLIELNRAAVVAVDELPDDVVRMGSWVLYRADNQVSREVKLVYPAHADIAEGRISVMTPFGAALIGMRQGASIDWAARDGRFHKLTVLRVSHESGDRPGPQAA